MSIIDTTSLRTDIGYLNYPEPAAAEPASSARDRGQPGTLRVAIVHYWLVSMRGGEKVIEELCQMFPQADIFTLVMDRDRLSDTLKTRRIYTSFLQKIPGAKRHYTKMLPLMPFALEQFDLSDYDLVLSSESGPAKGIVTRPDALHICYCHSPMRYIWDQFHVYRGSLPWIGRMLMSLTAPVLRSWDVTTSARVDSFVANSAYVRGRIRRFYNRDATVIHPPVAVDDFTVGQGRGDFYLYAGQLTGYKRADIAVRACSETGRKLVVIGEGEQTAYLKSIAGPSVTFLGHQPFPILREHLSRCRALLFPGTEDFGILPVEAMASGRPVIAFDAGGARETVSSPDVGLRFSRQDEQGLLGAIEAFEAREDDYCPETIRRHAETFSSAVFHSRLRAFINSELAARNEPYVASAARLVAGERR